VTTRIERWLLDTNVWLFGLRRDEQFHACSELIYLVGKFSVVIPLQVFKELNANFTDNEARSFHRLVNNQPEFVELNWERAPAERVKHFEDRGCRKGDAIIAAHAEAGKVDLIVTENRQFLRTVTDLKVKILSPDSACAALKGETQFGHLRAFSQMLA
jgi:predicted nucleic acid-binding protein